MALKRRSLMILAVLVLFLVIPVSHLRAQGGPIVDRSGGPRDMVEVALFAGAAPSPAGETTLTLEVKPYADAPDLLVKWQTPAGATLIGDAEEHLGAVRAGQTVTSTRRVRFDSQGVYKITGAAVLDYGPDLQFGAAGVVFYTIRPAFPAVSDKDPLARNPMGTKMPGVVSSGTGKFVPNAATDDPCFTISGTITRTERSPRSAGYVDSTGVPVRRAYVEILEEDTIFDDTIYRIDTDDNGYFEHSFCDDDGFFGGDNLELYVRLHAELFEGTHKVVEVEDSSWVDEIYTYDSDVLSSDGGTHVFDFTLDIDQSAVFNIADAILDAYRVWRDSGGEAGGDSLFDGEGEVHWEPGYGDSGSYYNPFWNEITLADDPSDPDAWDDSVIIHEWGHMADDYYSCDDNPGGDHFIGKLAASADLAWGEGYPDYWQSVVRATVGQTDGNRYLDINGSGTPSINVNLEPTQPAAVVSVRYEMAIAGALWDLFDAVDDGQDTITLGHVPAQEVYTGDDFDDIASGWFDDTCTFDVYARAWVAGGQQADGPAAAVIMQNTGFTLPPPSVAMRAANATETGGALGPTDGAWWNQITYVVDNSKSMAGARINAVKTVLVEAINDLGDAPEGTEFSLVTFDNTSFLQTPVFAGQFFPERLTPVIAGLGTSETADNTCLSLSLYQLEQAIQDQQGGHAWLFTDSNTINYPPVENLKLTLNEREIRASVALLAGCPLTLAAAGEAGGDAFPAGRQLAETAGIPELGAANSQIAAEGALERYLGPAAEETPPGIVPYLLTAINSGGSFLYVDPAQADQAADVMRAQITHSAGAGTWSDYVSDSATYRWDELASWEYDWIDAAGGGTNHGTPVSNSYLDITLPGLFTFYGQGPYSAVRAYEKGYLTLGGDPFGASQAENTPLPNPAFPNNAIYPYWDNLDYLIFCAQSTDAPECEGPPAGIHSRQQGDWFAIEQKNYYSAGITGYVDFQTQLNLRTGEIRFLYNDLDSIGASSATVGLENAAGSSGVQISYNDINGAADGMGYKLTPAPAQPTRTYTTRVDEQMSGIAFLLTGYSGDFESLVIKYPGGQQVDCADTANVLCLNLGLVQYVQANTAGHYGDWQAIVDAGPGGEGTFSFFSMAASPISVDSVGPRNLGTGVGDGIVVEMGGPLDSSKLRGWFVRPDGTLFGPPFDLFDDGAHNDGRSGDGFYGSGLYTPPGAGAAYLFIRGTHQGKSFVRNDPVPYNFNPVTLESLGDETYTGGTTQLQFRLTNLDTVRHTYLLNTSAPLTWNVVLPDRVGVDPGQAVTINVDVTWGPGGSELPSGTSGEVVLSAVEEEEGVMSATASAVITRHRPPADIQIFNNVLYLRPGGEKAELAFFVFDEQGVGVADGTQVNLSASKGTMSPAVGITQGGTFTAEFTSGNSTGTALITAQVEQPARAAGAAVQAQTEIEIGAAPANAITLSAAQTTLAPGGKTALTARVTNRYGEPVAGQKVRIGISGDGQMGTVGSNQEAITGVTNGNGLLTVTFTAGGQPGLADARAELLVMDGSEERVVHEARQELFILGGVFLPVITTK